MIQKSLRSVLAVKKVAHMKTLKQNLKLKKFCRNFFRQNLKTIASEYRLERQKKTIICQKFLKGHLGRKLTEKRKLRELKWKSAILIQCYLRKMEACEVVYMRRLIVKSCKTIQKAYRGYLARKQFKVLKFKRERVLQKKAKEAAKQAEKEKKYNMEDFIENLLAKELRTPKEAKLRP